jgi:hypothetical protein
MGSGVFGLWSGDLDGNGITRYAGPTNDATFLKSSVVNNPSNTTNSSFFPYNAYDNADLNLDGQVRYAGPGNDAVTLKSTIIAFPGNTTGSAFYPISQQLPN